MNSALSITRHNNPYAELGITVSNILALDYTNYVPAGTAVTMYSLLTNVPAAITSYAWDFNLVNIGVTTPNLTLPATSVTPAKSGMYSVFFSSTNSGTAIVSGQEYDSYWSFGYVPGFTNAPASLTNSSGANATFSVGVTGTTPAVFWYQNVTNLIASRTVAYNPATAVANAVSTNISLVLSNLTATNAGSYTLVVTNNWGSITSSPALLTVVSSLAVTTPAGQTNYAGNSVNLTVAPSGTAPLSYQWLKGSTKLANAGDLSGTTTTNLTIAPAAVGDSGNYSVIVTNTSGSVTSGVAVVSIVPVPGVSAFLSGNNLSLTSTGGIDNRTYIVQTSTNLAASSWQPLLTNQASPVGGISFTGTNTPGSSQRYYQLKFP